MSRKREPGFTLIHAIVALAIVTALLTALAIPFVKRLDRIAGQKESAALKAMGAAFKESVKRTRYVPDHNGWATNVAGQLGWQVGDVTANHRGLARVFLIDPAMQIETNNATPLLPYDQSITGSMVLSNGIIVRPFSPRFMIISTLGKTLPGGLVSGLGATSGANAFTNIWSTKEGLVPTGWSWSSGADLKIERIDIADLFVQVALANLESSGSPPLYGIDSELNGAGEPKSPVPASPPPMYMYFIRGSELKLYDPAGVLEYTEILFTSRDFTYELGSWQAKPFLGRGVSNPMGKEMQRAVELFLRAPQNPYAKFGTTREDVFYAMADYMTAFVAWRDNANYLDEGCPGPVGNNTYTDDLNAAATALDNTTGNLINP
jgi:type II secretory pathway pseudopilin PulG